MFSGAALDFFGRQFLGLEQGGHGLLAESGLQLTVRTVREQVGPAFLGQVLERFGGDA
ncbi:hypothetical protein ACFPH6_32780 [Streptomyces xiangluensis]|uniref:Uncharacterized protein n=1 Tax=Streptomyces xiangluensis TaxID=2665720 RepID=A0ABV8YYW1_9ACTN